MLPVVYGASIALSAGIGFLVFKEPVSVIRDQGRRGGPIVTGIGLLAAA